MRPRALARELLEELGGQHGHASPEDRGVLHVGERRVDVAPEAFVERHRPGVVAACFPGRDDLVPPGGVVAEHARVEVAERGLHHAGEGREVDDVRGALLARVRERVGEHEPAFGVRVDDLDRLAVHRVEDVTGPVRAPAGHVLGRGDDPDGAESGGRARRRRPALRGLPPRRPCRSSCPPCTARA